MRSIEPTLTDELKRHVNGSPVWRAKPFRVGTYRALVQIVARLAYANPNHLLFFRGQEKDFQSKAEGSTLYPAIYRGDNVPHRELVQRFEQLEIASTHLVARFVLKKIEGHRDLERKRYIQWSILQHYNVIPTPLLDVTQSLRVACSFAQFAGPDRPWDPNCYVYVLGLPYNMNRISINSEEEIVNIRLLSICPPTAIRPYFQEGYMAGTPDVTYDFESKTELDFRNRLIAKFEIPRVPNNFWRGGFAGIPERALTPPRDPIEKVCADVKQLIQRAQQPPGTLGDFIFAWAKLEQWLLDAARRITERNVSVPEAVNAVSRRLRLSEPIVAELHALRQIRNMAVHKPQELERRQIEDAHRRLLDLLNQLPEGAA